MTEISEEKEKAAMTTINWMLIAAGVTVGLVVFGAIEAVVIKRHNERLIKEVQSHISSMDISLHDTIGEAHKTIKSVDAKVDAAISQTKDALNKV